MLTVCIHAALKHSYSWVKNHRLAILPYMQYVATMNLLYVMECKLMQTD